MALGNNPPGPIALVAIDLDGTLVRRGDEVTAGTKAALQRARAAGLRLVLATGRRYRTTRRVMQALELDLPAICLGGALTKDAGGETVRSRALMPRSARALLTLARRHDIALAFQRDAHALGGPDFIIDAAPAWNDSTKRYVAAGAGRCRAETRPEQSRCDDLLVAGCFGDRAVLAAFQSEAEAELAGAIASVLVASQKTPGWYLEITAHAVDKWRALRRFAADVGVAESAVCAVGDALNDLPMIRGAGYGVAMDNADPAVKAAADWITGANHDDGVAMLVDRLIR